MYNLHTQCITVEKKNPTSYMYLTSAECWHIHIMSSTSTWNSSNNNLCSNVSCTHVHVLEILYRFNYLHTHQQCKLRYIIFCVFAHLHTTDKSECMYTFINISTKSIQIVPCYSSKNIFHSKNVSNLHAPSYNVHSDWGFAPNSYQKKIFKKY